MKKFVFLIVFLLPAIAFTQVGKIPADLYLRVVNSKNEPQQFCKLWLIEKESGDSLPAHTNKKGKALFKVHKGSSYVVNFQDIRNHSVITIAKRNRSYFLKTITYNMPKSAQKEELKTAKNDTIIQKIQRKDKAKRSEALVKIKVRNAGNKPQKRLKVFLRAPDIQRVYVAKTDASGTARFIVPINGKYQPSIGEFSNYNTFKLPNRAGITAIREIRFVPTKVKERRKNDTIIQQLPAKVEPTSARIYVHMTIRNYENQLLENERVYLNAIDEKVVYMTTTNKKGVADFLIPKGDRYTLHLTYERDIDLLDYPIRWGLHSTEINFHYIGTEQVKEFYKTTQRDKNGFITEFMTSKVERLPFQSSWLENRADGYRINFPSHSSISVPAIGGKRLFTPAGYYTNNLFCVNAKTGRYRWGAKFLEGGPSAVVYSEDVVVVNTQSCTLYALNARNGNLLWSKWLAPNIYSTPSVANGKVFTIYPNNLPTKFKKQKQRKEEFVLVAFDLQTGEVVWQNWIDREVLAAPVISNNSVYLTSMSGKLYHFSEETGELLQSADIHAVTPPTITSDKLYVSVRDSKNVKKQVLAIVNKETLKIEQIVERISGTVEFERLRDLSAARLMNYNNSRILNYKDLNFNVMGSRLICSKPTNGEIVWSAQLSDKEGFKAYMPIAVSGQIIVSQSDGKIRFFDYQSGKISAEFDTGEELFGSPLVYKGDVFSGSKAGKLIKIETHNGSYDNWYQWNGNSEHNPDF